MTSNLTKNLYAELDDSDFVEEESYDDFDDDWDEDFESIETKRFSAKHECYEDD